MSAPDIVQINLYGGSCDGCFIQAHPKQSHFRVNYAVIPQPDGTHAVSFDIKPGMEVHQADYVVSFDWTWFFKRPTAIPNGFPGKPPKEPAAA